MADATSTPVKSVEQWKPVVGFEDRYEVSDFGSVRSFVRPCRYYALRREHSKTLMGDLDRRGYCRVVLYSVGGKRNRRLVHCLVMLTFVGPKPDGFQVNHKDGNKADNRLANLEYVTASENRKHAFRIGLQRRPSRRGEDAWGARLSVGDIREIRRLRAAGTKCKVVADRFGVCISHVSKITSRHVWGHVG